MQDLFTNMFFSFFCFSLLFPSCNISSIYVHKVTYFECWRSNLIVNFPFLFKVAILLHCQTSLQNTEKNQANNNSIRIVFWSGLYHKRHDQRWFSPSTLPLLNPIWSIVSSWAPLQKKDIDLLELVQKKVMKMIQKLEHLSCEAGRAGAVQVKWRLCGDLRAPFSA